jgi:hypothetical protein
MHAEIIDGDHPVISLQRFSEGHLFFKMASLVTNINRHCDG